MKNKSYFDGDIFSYIGYSIICGILIVITIGFGTPWAVCIMLRWKTNHTIIDGRRMYFDGNGASLFGHWVVWYLLCFITLGIYGFWLTIKMEQWKAKHTHFIED